MIQHSRSEKSATNQVARPGIEPESLARLVERLLYQLKYSGPDTILTLFLLDFKLSNIISLIGW